LICVAANTEQNRTERVVFAVYQHAPEAHALTYLIAEKLATLVYRINSASAAGFGSTRLDSGGSDFRTDRAKRIKPGLNFGNVLR